MSKIKIGDWVTCYGGKRCGVVQYSEAIDGIGMVFTVSGSIKRYRAEELTRLPASPQTMAKLYRLAMKWGRAYERHGTEDNGPTVMALANAEGDLVIALAKEIARTRATPSGSRKGRET